MDSRITIGKPTMIADSRNSTGRIGVFHSGLSFVGAISISVPSEDWCMKDSTTPATMNSGRTIPTPACSARIGFSTRRSNAAPHSPWSSPCPQPFQNGRAHLHGAEP